MIMPVIGESMFPLTETTSLMEEKPPKYSLAFFPLRLAVPLITTMLAEPGLDPLMHIHLPAEQSPLTSKVKPRGKSQEKKKIESELLGYAWTSSFI